MIEFDGEAFVDLNIPIDKPVEEPSIELNKGQFTVGSVLPNIKNRYSSKFKTGKKLMVKD